MNPRLVLIVVAAVAVVLAVLVFTSSTYRSVGGTQPPPPGGSNPPPPLPSGWNHVATGASPSSNAAMMTYDPRVQGLVLVDTDSSCNHSYTWIYRNGMWTNLTHSASLGPFPARSHGGMVYDSAVEADILFGGASACGTYNDTWAYSNGTWTLLHPKVSPPPLSRFATTYDVSDGYVVLVGGCCIAGQISRETWAFEADTWVNLTQAPNPLVDEDSGLTYDSAMGKVVFVGGYASGFVSQATWTFHGGNWTRLYPLPSPSNRAGLGLAYDSNLTEVVLLGGYTKITRGVWLNLTDTWIYYGGDWTNITANLSASPPWGQGVSVMAYDAATQLVVLFAGYGQTWTLG